MSDRAWGLFVYPWDFARDEVEGRVALVRSLGIQRLICAVLYHDGRQFSPTGPRRVVWVEGGTSHVPVRGSRYPAGLAPPESGLEPSVAELARAAAAAGLDLEGWTVTLHRDDLLRRPHAGAPLVENAFGEKHPVQLCPSAPQTAEYLAAHLAALAEAGLRAVTLEGCNFPGLLHGYHHESFFPPLTEHESWLAALCFCAYCAERSQDGLDFAAARRQTVAAIEAALQGGERPAQELSRDLQSLVQVRIDAVTELVEVVARDSRLELRFGDQATIAGSVFRTGRAGGQPSALEGWRYGLDYRRLSNAVAAVAVCGYLTDPLELEQQLGSYLELGVRPGGFDVVLRPMPPDTDNAEQLARRVQLAIAAGARQIDFYNLGFARPHDLEILGRVLAEAA
jgi:hypothetical protein